MRKWRKVLPATRSPSLGGGVLPPFVPENGRSDGPLADANNDLHVWGGLAQLSNRLLATSGGAGAKPAGSML